ncbi:hypothetical protein BLL42_01190 [Pseudomonas frederiksbergensis]|uniref:Lipoprotein n=1 Tax=Pseudomonas frederiksbergensis TaxID=104087 RepID=A0A1J0EE93_9PSED|nr:hypothetical protein [Pseudomonas frederiksbergensis]APC14421.1 hypothetical protein BLL42_01190 [Pseudomonas frederiksbergensis]
MKLNLVKAFLIAGTLLLSACSGMTTSSCFSEDCHQFNGQGANKMSFGGSPIGNSFNQYSSGLMQHD